MWGQPGGGGRLWRQPGEGRAVVGTARWGEGGCGDRQVRGGGGCGDSQVRGGRLWGQPGEGAVVGTAR